MRVGLSILCVVALLSCSSQTVTPTVATHPSLHMAHSNVSGFSHLFDFSGPDGEHPFAALLDINDILYGTTADGGANAKGTVFRITTSGKEQVVYSFKGYPVDGAHPVGGLTDSGGLLYGTTSDSATIFDITLSGKETVLHRFVGRHDGRRPVSDLLDVGGAFYGTTEGGGYSGNGTVFVLERSGKERVIYSFGPRPDGSNPMARLLDVSGALYGTTAYGANDLDGGIIYRITSSGMENILHTFKGEAASPMAGLIDMNGLLYGTAYHAGAYHNGAVFAMTPSGTVKLLYRFKGKSDGAGPSAELTDVNGTLYGTTFAGGGSSNCFILYGYNGCGTIFSITPAGTETVLYRFTGGADGAGPRAKLLNVNGTLYGTTAYGGNSTCKGNFYVFTGCGTVFTFRP